MYDRVHSLEISSTALHNHHSRENSYSPTTLTHCGYSEINRFYPSFSAGDRTRSFLKVQDGCDYKCSYCTIHYARGASRNAPIAQVVEQAREIAARGVREIVITGVNTGDFGRSTGESFIDLLRALDRVEGIERYRISSIEPNLLTDAVIEFCASSCKLQPHFHIPLQSGSDRILGLMRRRYTTARFAERIEKVRRVMPDAFIGIDVIVGFPGETEEDFTTTRAFLEQIRPAQLHVFPYSVRPGTPAAEMPGRVTPAVAAERAATLGALSDELHAEFAARFRGTEAEVLWEGDRRGGTMSGFTGNYLKVTAPYDPALVNTITKVRL
jgi:threonylcarbamoyladenosine tRNA methylthiotransferase MtaB